VKLRTEEPQQTAMNASFFDAMHYRLMYLEMTIGNMQKSIWPNSCDGVPFMMQNLEKGVDEKAYHAPTHLTTPTNDHQAMERVDNILLTPTPDLEEKMKVLDLYDQRLDELEGNVRDLSSANRLEEERIMSVESNVDSFSGLMQQHLDELSKKIEGQMRELNGDMEKLRGDVQASIGAHSDKNHGQISEYTVVSSARPKSNSDEQQKQEEFDEDQEQRILKLEAALSMKGEGKGKPTDVRILFMESACKEQKKGKCK